MTDRRCPRCTFTLVPHVPPALAGATGGEIDVCPRCQGAFFDVGDAQGMLGDNAEPAVWAKSSATTYEGKGKLGCPAGHGRLGVHRLRSPPTNGVEVEVDVCPVCGGMWLDAWEAARLAQATRALPAERSSPVDAARTGAGWYLFQLFSGMPVEEYNPVRKRPWVVLSLVAACVAVYALEVSAGDGVDVLLRTWGLVPADVLAGVHLQSLVTHLFLHGGLAHIAANMWFLFTFGDNIEERVGHGRFLLLYLVFGLCAACSQLIMSVGSTAPLVGASGAIAGLMGAYAVLFPRARVFHVILFVRFKIPVIVYLTLWMLLQAVMGFLSLAAGHGAGVAWWAHLGGFAVGAFWGVLARDRFGDGAETRRR